MTQESRRPWSKSLLKRKTPSMLPNTAKSRDRKLEESHPKIEYATDNTITESRIA